MNWYYVAGGQQVGPVDEARFAELVRSGEVLFDTLVWSEGMADWRRYGEISSGSASAPQAPPLAAAVAAPPVAAGQAVCAECRGVFNIEQMMSYGGRHVCVACKPVFLQKIAEGASLGVMVAPRYAGFWIRFAAKLLDGVILGIPLGAVLGVLLVTATRSSGANRPFESADFMVLRLVFQFGFMVVQWGYEIFFVGKYGATPGKMACGLRIVTADGRALTYGQATGRTFAELLSGLTCYIGFIMAGFDEEKRALHDRICNTRVIYKTM